MQRDSRQGLDLSRLGSNSRVLRDANSQLCGQPDQRKGGTTAVAASIPQSAGLLQLINTLGPVSTAALRSGRSRPALRCFARPAGRSPTVPSAARAHSPLGPVSDRALRCSRARRSGRSPTVPSAAPRAPTARAGLRPCPAARRARSGRSPTVPSAAHAPTARAGLRPCPLTTQS